MAIGHVSGLDKFMKEVCGECDAGVWAEVR